MTGNNVPTCKLVDDCPLQEDCEYDGKAEPSTCPMKLWSFDELLDNVHVCIECDSLEQFETTYTRDLTSQDSRDLSQYWMEHLNKHLDKFAAQKLQ